MNDYSSKVLEKSEATDSDGISKLKRRKLPKTMYSD